MKKFFPTPDENHFGQFNTPQWLALNYIKEKMNNHEYEFNPPYQISQYQLLIEANLRDSN